MSPDVDEARALFAFMKQANTLDEIATRSIPVLGELNQVLGYLTPIGALDVSDSRLVDQLASWRSAHAYAYPTRANITASSTQSWLRDAVVANESRLLFLIRDPHLYPVGHLGLLIQGERLEVDNVLRGRPEAPGLMRSAMKSLEGWALAELDAQELELRVLASNVRALNFYAELGYSERQREPMGWIADGDRVLLSASAPQKDDSLVTMAKDLQTAEPAEPVVLTAGPLIGVREASLVLDATRWGWNRHHSDYLNEFETSFARFVNCSHALATSSCTGALHLALLALGVGPGDEVIVPETTWVATASAVMYVGATPVFADVDATTWTMTPETLVAAISNRTKAVIPVHLYGYAADMPGIMEVARSHNLFVIEDAAPAIGARVAGRPVGSFGEFGAFSFQGAKMLVTGEGGMLVTNHDGLRDRAWKQQDHGRKPGTFWIEELGRKYKMSNTTAALGLAQLRSAQTQIVKKRRINSWYREFLGNTPGVSFQQELPDSFAICWMTSVSLDPTVTSREAVMEALAKQGIDTRPVFPAISQYPIWGGASTAAGPVAERIGRTSLNLPSGVRLSRSSVERVAEAVHEVITHAG